MTDFAISNLPGPAGSLQRARLYAAVTGATVISEALVEAPAGLFGGNVTISPAPPDNLTSPYEYEVRQVATQDDAGFNASTTITVSRGTYGYLSGGVWYGEPPLGAVAGFWWSQAGVQQSNGVVSTDLNVDLNNDGTGTAAVWQRAGDFTDARIDLVLAVYGKTRPASKTGTAYTFVSRVANAQVARDINNPRGQYETNAAGGANVGGTLNKEAADLWAMFVEKLEAGALDFPDVTDAAGEIELNAPVILRPTIDEEGRAVAVAADYQRPYWDRNSGWWRW